MSRKLETLNPVVASLARRLIQVTSDNQIPIVITQTLRTFEEQDKLYAQGRTEPGNIVTNARGGDSYHNYGLAFDFALLHGTNISWDTKVDVNDNEIPDFTDVGLMGESIGLTWGGRWKFMDLPHFQYTFGLSINDLKSGTRPPEGTLTG